MAKSKTKADSTDGSNKVPKTKLIAGGSATGGGMNFQAAVTAVAGAHLIKGAPICWLDGRADDVPTAIWAESGGAGDDIRLELKNGALVEVQVKKGLQSGSRLWDALLSLARAVSAGEAAWGLLAVSPDSSRAIAYGLATDIKHLADGRIDCLHPLGKTWAKKLTEVGLPIAETCAKLRIHTVHAVDSDSSDIASAKTLLASVVKGPTEAKLVWDAVLQDAHTLIARRGRWTIRSIRNLLTSVPVKMDVGTSPIQVTARICEWVERANRAFTILGVKKELPIDEAWIPLKAVVTDASNQEEGDVATALAQYHDKSSRPASGSNTRVLDAEWLGRFYRHAVVVAGPGMGKSTLLTKLARSYARDGYPVLKVRLAMIAARMAEGRDFTEMVMQLGLSGSGVLPQSVIGANLRDWVLLCDGLDECHAHHDLVAEAIAQFSIGFPDVRIVVTTRPIGYHTARLCLWRHYELCATERSAASAYLANVLREILPDGSSLLSHVDEEAARALNGKVGESVKWSPHMLCLAASLLARGGKLGSSKSEMYESLFSLIDSAPSARNASVSTPKSTLLRVLDNLGWEITSDPLGSADVIQDRCAKRLGKDLGVKELHAKEIIEDCVRYWRGVGLVELLHHSQSSLLTFVHKTFAEFAAARFLDRSVKDGERSGLIERALGDDGSSEVLEFSGDLGRGQDIVDCLLKDVEHSSIGSLLLALKLVASSEAKIEEWSRLQLVSHAWKIIGSEDPERIYELGEVMADAARRYPREFSSVAAALVSSPYEWTRLTAWLCLVEADPEHYELQAAIDALPELAAEADALSGSILGSLVLRKRSGGLGLLQRLAVKIAERLAKEGSPEVKEAFLAAIDTKSLNTLGFNRRVSEALGTPSLQFRNLGKNLASSAEWFKKMMEPDEFSRAERVAMDVLLGTLVNEDQNSLSTDLRGSNFVQLSAFIQLTGFEETTYSDILAWTKPFEMDVVREVVRSLARVSGLDYSALRSEAALALHMLGQDNAHQLWWRIFERVSVDVPDPRWSDVAHMSADRGLLLEGVLHKSSWVMVCATNLVEGFGPIEDHEVKWLLAEAAGESFAGVAYLAGTLGERGGELLVDRANGTQVRGLQYVYKKLEELKAPLSALMITAIERGLASRHVAVAKSSAQLALEFARSGAAIPQALFGTAYGHWLVHEEPYPQQGGVVPESPRSTLLEGMLLLGALADGQLIEATNDSRSDVGEIARSELLRRMTLSEDTAATVVVSVLDKTISPRALNGMLSKHASIPRAQVDHLLVLFDDPDPKYRRAACGLLDAEYLDQETIAEYASRISSDDEREIRDLAKALLVRRGLSVSTH